MVDVQELVVRAIPEGVGEVQDELDGVTESVEESGEQMEETADNFGDLQKRFSGAGAAIAGAFAATTGIFLGRVPILSETIDALGAVFDALGLQVDSLLRGPFTRFNNFLFGISDTISQAEGPLGNLIGAFAGIGAAAIGAVTAFAAWKVKSLGLIGGLKATGAALLTVGKIIGGLIATIIGIKAAIAIALAAIVGFVAAYLTNWRGTRDKTDAIVGQILDFVVSGFNSLVSKGSKLLGEFVSAVKSKGVDAVNATKDFVNDIGSKFDDLVSDARDWGENLIGAFIDGVESKVSTLKSKVSDVAGIISDHLPSSDADTGPLSNLTSQGAGLISAFVGGASGESNDLPGFLRGMLEKATSVFKTLGSEARAFSGRFRGIINNIQTKIPTPELNLSSALQTVSEFVSTINGFTRELAGMFKRLAAMIRKSVNQSISDMERLDTTMSENITTERTLTTQANGNSSDDSTDFIGSVGGGRGTINLDGRDVENTQGRYRADNLHRRGG